MQSMQFLAQQLANGVILGSVYAIVAVGLTLVFGVMGVINLAQGDFFMAGAFAGLLALQAGVGLPGAIIAGASCAALAGFLAERLALRPLPDGIDPHIPMVATIGVSIVIQQLAMKMFTARAQPYPTPVALEQRISLGLVQFDYLNLLILGFALGLMVVLAVVLRRSRLGISIRAVAENPHVATLMGIDRRKIVMLVFVVSAALAGIAGVLVGMYFNNVNPYIGIGIGFKGLAAVIFGGLGSVTGAVTASLMIGITEALTVSYIDSSWRDAIAFGVMILVLLVRPAGLFGLRNTEKV